MLTLSLNDLLEFTDWEREKYRSLFQQYGEKAWELHAGPHGDGRFERVSDVARHIFSAEKRYVERLASQPLTDANSIPKGIEALFQFGQQSRSEFQHLVKTFPAQDWDVPREMKILTYTARVTPRKIALHVLIHEIRHWAQIATLLRLNGFKVEFHDFLFSPVLGGEVV
jgi:uncharacterized damage-inducible protein DinB